jgi:hypothetical protein
MAFLNVEDESIRAGLHSDLMTAFPDLTAIYDDREEVPTNAANLPYALITLGDPEPDDERSTVTRDCYRYPYEIYLRGVRPGSGTLRTAKNTLLSALGAVLCASPRWRGYEYQADGIAYGDEERDAQMGELTCSLRLSIWGNQ